MLKYVFFISIYLKDPSFDENHKYKQIMIIAHGEKEAISKARDWLYKTGELPLGYETKFVITKVNPWW